MRQSSVALDFYLSELHQLGAELSQSLRLVSVSPELEALAARSPDASEHRRDELYRRALIGMYARLAATSRHLDQHPPERQEVAPAQPYADAGEFAGELEVIGRSLTQNGSARLASGRLRNLKRAAEVFGFHLAPLDMRQHSGVHDKVVAELFLLGAHREGYDQLPEQERRRWLLAELTVPRLLRSPFLSYTPDTENELRIWKERAERLEGELKATLDLIGDQKEAIAKFQSLPNYESVIGLIESSAVRIDEASTARTLAAVSEMEQLFEAHERRAQERHAGQMEILRLILKHKEAA